MIAQLVYAFRSLRRGSAAGWIGVVVLALGLATTISIFSLYDALLLRALPLPDVERIVQIQLVRPDGPSPQVSEPHYVFWRSHTTSFESLTAYRDERYNLSDAEQPRSVHGSRVTPNFFSTYGLDLALGAGFSESGGETAEVILSYGLWQEAFASDRAVVGRQITLDSSRYTVVGVASAIPRRRPVDQELWTPLAIDPASREGSVVLRAVGRLKEGVTRAQAQAELASVQQRLLELAGVKNGAGVSLNPVQEFMYGGRRSTLLLLMSAAGFVLLLGSANLANLQLTRVARRAREVAIRRALGASAIQTLMPLAVEALLISFAGAGSGIVIAMLILRWLQSSQAAFLVGIPEFGIDLRVAGFAVAVSVAAVLIASIVPALEAMRVDPSRRLGGRSSDSGGSPHWSRPVLVAGEVAVTVWAVAMAILLLESYQRVIAVDPGFNSTANILTVELPLTRSPHGDPIGLDALVGVLLPRLRELPGVDSVSVTSSLPLESGSFLTYAIDGADEDLAEGLAQFRAVSPDFFATLGIRIVAGRRFTEADRGGAAPVAIISEGAAQRHWPGRSPIGQRITVFPGSRYGESLPRMVVGVVNDVNELGLVEREPWESLYVPVTQLALPLARPILGGGVLLALRSTNEVGPLVGPVKAAIRDHEKTLPIGAVRTIRDIARRSAGPHQFRGTVGSAFAVMALLLAAVGIYGVMSVLAEARQRELAIRFALGSTVGRLVRLILRQGVSSVAIGGVLGLVGIALSVRLLGTFLFGVKAGGAGAIGVTLAVVAVTALLAMLPPAIRSARTDPRSLLGGE